MRATLSLVALASLLSLVSACQAAPPPRTDGFSGGGDGPGKGSDWPREGGALADLPPPVPYQGKLPGGQGELSGSLTVAGQARSLRVYRPASVKAGAPLILAFHGTHGSSRDMTKPSSVGARELADREGLVLIAPQARKMQKGDWDNHSSGDVYWETYPSTDPAQNPDLLLVRALIAEAARAYGVDRRRVYALGHSNGGFFAVLAATALRDQIAAFVSNSAGLVRCPRTGSCKFKGSDKSCASLAQDPGYCACDGAEKPGPLPQSGRKPAAYLSHSVDDPTVSVYYTCELASRLKALGYPVELRLRSGIGHGVPFPLAIDAWSFLKKHSL